MSSFASKTLGRFLLPNFEKDLAKAVHEGIQSSAKMTDCFLAPSVYGFEKQSAVGLGHATSAVEKRLVEKVHYEVPIRGLFQ
mmetsp:Transcript_19612/g.48815  ORF Transcript_19612/g.48815 Transcript_19612/m.48815 type:complete len:82 (+) Transcript_19612:122-367(+)